METPASMDLATILTLIFYIMSLFYVIFSVVFYYHWMQYAVDKNIRRITLLTYLATTLPLIGIMALITFAL